MAPSNLRYLLSIKGLSELIEKQLPSKKQKTKKNPSTSIGSPKCSLKLGPNKFSLDKTSQTHSYKYLEHRLGRDNSSILISIEN